MPLIRYWTNDYVVWTHEKCECGSDLPRILKYEFRADQMVKFKGVLINPVEIEDIIERELELGERYRIVVYNENQLDKIKIEVEVKMHGTDELRTKLEENIISRIGVKMDVHLLSSGSLSNDWKLKHVWDFRENL